MELLCMSCHRTLNEDEFTKFDRNPSLADRNGRVVFCKSCCNKMVEENGNDADALRNVLRAIDIPYIQSYVDTAIKSLEKKKQKTNVIIKKNVYSGESEETGTESITIQTTLYTCYSSKIGIMPKQYINFTFSDGLRTEDVEKKTKTSDLTEEEKNVLSAQKSLRKIFGDEIYSDKERLAKAVKLQMDKLSLHKNNVNARQQKFKLKSNVVALIDYGELDKNKFPYLYDNSDEKEEQANFENTLIDNVNIDEDNEDKIIFKVPKNLDINALADKWGYGYTPEQLYAFEKKYQMLKNNYPEKTALHTEGLLTYIRYRVNEEIATAKGNVKDAKDWGELASKQATNAKINVSQLSKSDLSDGLDSFGTLIKAVETAVDIIPILPKFREQPQDKVDFTLWCYINYVRDLKGLPPAEYDDIYKFYDERKKEYEARYESLQDTGEDDLSDDEDVGDDDDIT